MNNLTFELIEEFRLEESTKNQISDLLKLSFLEVEFHNRTYFKQLPQYRLLLKNKEELIGQLGLDYRVMTLNAKPIRVIGIIDFAVFPTHQGKGYGTKLLNKLDAIAKEHINNIDFLFLVTDNPKIYQKNGYRLSDQKVKWLAIDQHVNYGLYEKELLDCLMYKPIGQQQWDNNGHLDLLGYLY
ncbi:MAG: GNAT family N-acetyltransferase [Aureispira sp.]|nr:GNAT family N-acetyltransferase [Aureispira sp.]